MRAVDTLLRSLTHQMTSRTIVPIYKRGYLIQAPKEKRFYDRPFDQSHYQETENVSTHFHATDLVFANKQCVNKSGDKNRCYL